MSTLLDRLQQLRRDAGVANDSRGAATRAPAPGDVGDAITAAVGLGADATRADRLARLRRLIDVRHRPAVAGATQATTLPGAEIAPGLRYVESRVADTAADADITLPFAEPLRVPRSRLVCFDTETTGLTRGVGTRAFMIGAACVSDGGILVRQLYLSAMAGEHAMLDTFAGWIDADAVLVSYNGRSYDAPLLKARYRLHRLPHRLDSVPHLDWLYATRRAYRATLENCRLATIEREVLRIRRDDDLPGAQAPAAWLRHLRGHGSADLVRVLEHNRQDVLTLLRLGDHLGART